MAYQQQNNGEKKKPKAPLDFMKLAMSTECPGNPGQWSSLQWRMSGQNFQCVVYTNDPNDKDNDNGRIDVKMPLDQFMFYLGNLKKVIFSKEAIKLPMQFMTRFAGKNRLDQPRVTDTLFVGKDHDGVCYITLERRNRPNIVFHFHPKTEQDYRFLNGDGTDMKEAELSRLYAEGHLEMLKMLPTYELLNRIIKHNEPNEFEAPRTFGSNQGGNGGGGNNNRGSYSGNSYGSSNGGNTQSQASSGGQSKPSFSEEDDADIPY